MSRNLVFGLAEAWDTERWGGDPVSMNRSQLVVAMAFLLAAVEMAVI